VESVQRLHFPRRQADGAQWGHLIFQLLKRQEIKWQRLGHPKKLREVKMPAWLALQMAL
jgi:hypothetical protein